MIEEDSNSSSMDSPQQRNPDYINMKKSCRICMSQFDLGIPLFEPNETLNNMTAASLIWNCFGIKIYKSDDLPGQICNECALNILISHNFKIQLQQSHKLLHPRAPDDQDGPSKVYRLVKMDDNLYRIAGNETNSIIDDDSDEILKHHERVLQNLVVDGKLDSDKDNFFLVYREKPQNTNASSELNVVDKQTNIIDVPKNLEEAYKWLRLTKELGPPYQCKLCNRTYETRYPSFYTHVRLHFVTKVQCALCPVKYLPNRKEYHMRTHTREKPYKCQNCDKRFSMQNHLNRHLKLRCSTIEEESICKVCSKTFSTNKLLHVHLIKEHGTCQHERNRKECTSCNKDHNKNVCEYCGLKVMRYNRHLNTCKAAPITMKFQLQNATTCKECGELIFSKYQLQCHAKKHENNKTHACSVCERVFLQKRYLKDHMEIHEPGEYPCEKCGKSFKRRLLLKLHRRTHDGKKKFGCAICRKCFRTKDHLNKHFVVHTKIKPFACTICEKAFSMKGNLNQHLLIHAKVKYFSCQICNKTFAVEGNLKKHMLSHKLSGNIDVPIT